MLIVVLSMLVSICANKEYIIIIINIVYHLVSHPCKLNVTLFTINLQHNIV